MEVARYLETYKIYEKKGTESIQGQIEDNYESRVNVLETLSLYYCTALPL
jgi:hypothetical protein